MDDKPLGGGVFVFPHGAIQSGEYVLVQEEGDIHSGGPVSKTIWVGGEFKTSE